MKDGRITPTIGHNHTPELSWLKRLEAKPSTSSQSGQNSKDEVNPVGDESFSPLITVAKYGHASVVQHLLQRQGIDVNLIDRSGFHALGWAALHGHTSVVKILLTQPCVDVNLPSVEGEGATPLFAAAQEGHDEVVELLLKHNDINVKVPLSGEIEEHDIHKTDGHGASPLLLPCKMGHEKVVELLLSNEDTPGMNCIKIVIPGKLILSKKRKGPILLKIHSLRE